MVGGSGDDARFWLECRACGTRRPAGSVDYRCAACGGELVVRYAAVGAVDDRQPGMWRYRSRLPIPEGAEPVWLGEGGTPLVPLQGAAVADSGAGSVAVKCEHLGPTGSFKDRIAAVAVTLAADRGLRGLAGTSSGNGGAAAAAYSTRAGLTLQLFALAGVPREKLDQLRALGARVAVVDGVGYDAAATERTALAVAERAAAAGVFPFLTGGRFSPEAMEGAKTIAYEIVEQHPEADVLYAPVGGGGLLSALGRGLGELASTGVRVPRLVAVQPSGCATLARALAGDPSGLDGPVTSGISGLQVAILFDPVGAPEAVRSTGGHLVEVDDTDIVEAQELLVHENGVLVEPAGATAFAGFLADARAGRVGAGEHVVVLATGAGYKDGRALARLAGDDAVPTIGLDDLEEYLR